MEEAIAHLENALCWLRLKEQLPQHRAAAVERIRLALGMLDQKANIDMALAASALHWRCPNCKKTHWVQSEDGELHSRTCQECEHTWTWTVPVAVA